MEILVKTINRRKKMRLPYDLIIFDMESNGATGPIIEIGARVLTRKGIILGQFQAFVKTDEKILKEITDLTNITDVEIETAETFPVVLKQFQEWIQKELGTKNFLLTSWSNWDTATLRRTCDEYKIDYPFRGKNLDAKSIVLWMSYLCDREVKSEGLKGMLEAWDLPFVGRQHSALCDAENTAFLLKRVWEYYDSRSETLVVTLRELGLAK
jgi:inhibitor of KinA sporulation pathway (predicted exonuclease)